MAIKARAVGTLLKRLKPRRRSLWSMKSRCYWCPRGRHARTSLRLNEGISGVTHSPRLSAICSASSVVDVRLRRVKGDLLTFDVRSEGDLQQLIDLIALDRDLTLLNSTLARYGLVPLVRRESWLGDQPVLQGMAGAVRST